MAAGTWLLVMATAALWLATYRLWRSTAKAVNDGEQSLAVAEAALAHARKSSSQELRAWLKVGADLKSCKRTKEAAHVTISTTLENVGKTPALRVAISVTCHVTLSGVANHGELPALDPYPMPTPPLLPGGKEVATAIGSRVKKTDLEKGIAAAREARFQPMIVVDVVAYYHTIFDAETDPKRLTSVRYQLHPLMNDDVNQAIRMAWLDESGPAAIDQVRFVQAKTAPTFLT